MMKNTTSKIEWIKFFEVIMLIMGIVGPFATAPQLIKLYHTHSKHAPGLSLSSWLAYLFLSVLWFLYGLIHKYYLSYKLLKTNQESIQKIESIKS